MSSTSLFKGHSKVGSEICGGIAGTGSCIVFGVGNVGSRLAPELTLLPGIKRIVLVDNDKVELRNLECCFLLSREDVGKFKADVIAKLIRRVSPEIEVVPIAETIDSIGLARFRDFHPSVAVGALDSRLSRYELARLAMLLRWPLVDAGIPGWGRAKAARVQVTWNDAKPVDPLDAWTEKDWVLIGRRRPCSPKVDSHSREKPVASSVSGALASAIAAAEVERLLHGDISNVGFEIRVDLSRGVLRRCALPASGLSPLSGTETIEEPPQKCVVNTLYELTNEAEALFGQNANLLLNRKISERFYCPACSSVESKAGPADAERACGGCGGPLVATSPIQQVSKRTMGSLKGERVSCLGLKRDIIGVNSRDGLQRGWLEYMECSNEKE